MFRVALCFFLFALAPGVAAPGFEREIVLAPEGGCTPEDRAIAAAQQQAALPDAGAAAWERLGWAFVAKARRTQDAGCYQLAAKTATVLERDYAAHEAALLLRGHALQNLHHFAAAESVARELVARAATPAALGLLSDALMEQGQLEGALAALQQMMALRPGPEAFSRAAQLRWLRGDVPGAIDALEQAWRMTGASDAEISAWMLTRLSALRLQQGEGPVAFALAREAAAVAPDYPPALFAQGRAAVALGRSAEAIASLARAAELTPLPEYEWWLADALRTAGRVNEADACEERLRRRGEQIDARSTALFLATRGVTPQRALKLARAELGQRADVFTHDALAWALAANGDFSAADSEMRAALAAGTRDARLFLHAAVIARALGRAAEATRHAASARASAGTLTPSEQALLTADFSPLHETQ